MNKLEITADNLIALLLPYYSINYGGSKMIAIDVIANFLKQFDTIVICNNDQNIDK